MSFKNLNFLLICCFTLIISGTLFSQEMEFPEDKVKYTINIVQEECVVTIIADIDIEEGWHINAVALSRKNIILFNLEISIFNVVFLMVTHLNSVCLGPILA